MAVEDPARSNPIQVLAKAGALLDALHDRGELTATELAEALGEPRSSVYRLLASLQELGFVAPGARRGTVQLGIKLFRLGSSALRSRDLRVAAHAPMHELADRTDHTIFLAVRSGHETLCIERIEGRWTVNNALMPGTTGPLHVGALGRILLAHEPPQLWDEYCGGAPLQRFTPHTIVEPAALVADLERVRAVGLAISDEDRLLGMAGVGAPVRDHEGAVVAAVSLSGPRPTILADNEQTSFALIRQTADAISATLGHEPAEQAA